MKAQNNVTVQDDTQSLQSCVSVSVTDKDFRIGNLINYRIVDKMDERQEWLEVSEIDYDDLRIFGIKDKINNDYQPIPLTEEWLLKLGFIFNGWNYDFENLRFHAQSKNEKGEFYNTEFYVKKGLEMVLVSFNVKFVHNMQNIYKELRGYELQIGNLTEH